MNQHDQTEELLRRTLRDEAETVSSSLTLDDVRPATGHRQHGWRLGVVVGVAAAAAIAVPAAVVIRSDTGTPSADATPSVTPSVTATSTASESPEPTTTSTPDVLSAALRSLPQTAAPGVTYLQDSTIHLAAGGTVPAPGKGPWAGFAAYHGGWLVSDPQLPGVRWYDNYGDLKRQSQGPSRLVASPDGMRVAFPMDHALLVGIASGMGEGEDKVQVTDPQEAWPVGFLSDGTLVYMDGGHVRTAQPAATAVPTEMARATAVSAEDVVAGTDQQGRGLAWSSRTGAVLWSGSPWSVTSFGPDGRYAAATGSGGDAVAILNSSTGDVVAHISFTGGRLSATSDPVLDPAGNLLVSVTDGASLEEAVLRLAPDGTVSRATQVFPLDPASDSTQIVFSTGP